jgi:glutathione peroxidase
MHGVSRRTFLIGSGLVGVAARARAADRVAWNFSMPSIEGGTLDLATYRGRTVLVANTASFCGFVDQYRGLEALNRSLSARGLTVVGMPSNDFNQEMDSNGKVKQFCELTYGVDFPMSGLTHVRGPEANPFYAWVRQATGWEPAWNFNKVLIGRDGRIHGTFGAKDTPESPQLRTAIDGALSATV